MTSKHLLNRNIFIAAILLFPILAFGQTTKQDSIWKPFKFFVGSWTGKGGGESGEGNYERKYQFIFNKKFIEVHNKSVYPPSENNPKGEVHEDVGYISFDKLRNTFILRQFHIEGFVNQYKLESISADGKRMVFISESIENIKPGWRAKETYQILGDNEFSETFELAPPDKEFEVYSKVILKKTE
ncbi:MAG: hypothetical protein HY964_05885 [Ignavibacteriales bacterium]|nr:hypothetical protein [Ignavibacteriales bacterium]